MSDCVIEVFAGELGSGKSYFAVQRVVAHIAAGGVVFSNLKLKPDGIVRYCRRVSGVEIDPKEQIRELRDDQVALFPEHIAAGSDTVPVMVVIDEAGLFFNSRDWATTSKRVLKLLTQSRKYRLHIMLLAQAFEDIDKQFRGRVQWLWMCRDLSKLQVPVIGIRWPFNQMVRVCYNPRMRDVMIRRSIVWKDTKIFDCYDTRAVFMERLLNEIEARFTVRKLTMWEKIAYAFSSDPGPFGGSRNARRAIGKEIRRRLFRLLGIKSGGSSQGGEPGQAAAG